jgi:hypothetical protein
MDEDGGQKGWRAREVRRAEEKKRRRIEEQMSW